jgi:hypothetical protein
MATNIRIQVYQGDRVELLPAMCMFCGHPLGEEQYQPVDVQIGQTVRKLAFPICLVDKLPEQLLAPDGRSEPVAGVNPQRYQPYLVATFAFQNVNAKFAQELERLRNLPHDQYDPQMAQSHEALQAVLQGKPTADAMDAEEHRRQTEAQEAEDEATFQLEKAAGTGDVSKAETKASSRKLIWICLIAGVLGLLLVMCIAVGISAYSFFSPKAKEQDKTTELPPPKEMKAKIKLIDRDRGTISVLGIDSKRYPFKITDATEFFDREGNPLPQKLGDPKIHEEEYCVVLPTQDRSALQWLKLTAAPK